MIQLVVYPFYTTFTQTVIILFYPIKMLMARKIICHRHLTVVSDNWEELDAS